MKFLEKLSMKVPNSIMLYTFKIKISLLIMYYFSSIHIINISIIFENIAKSRPPHTITCCIAVHTITVCISMSTIVKIIHDQKSKKLFETEVNGFSFLFYLKYQYFEIESIRLICSLFDGNACK